MLSIPERSDLQATIGVRQAQVKNEKNRTALQKIGEDYPAEYQAAAVESSPRQEAVLSNYREPKKVYQLEISICKLSSLNG